jgi:hypothetical protein
VGVASIRAGDAGGNVRPSIRAKRDERRHHRGAEKQPKEPHRLQAAESRAKPTERADAWRRRSEPANEVIGDEQKHAAEYDDDDLTERAADGQW